MLKGEQSWIFNCKPCILASSSIVGPLEGLGNLSDDFDSIHKDIWIGQNTFEQAERVMLQEACETAINKSGIPIDEIQFFLSGDLMNQIISSSFTARSLGIPYLGIFGACSSSMESLAIAALIVNSKAASKVLVAASSHNAAAEKQFRYPNEYGGQKPKTAQCTVTGAGAAIVSDSGSKIKITAATIGRVIDKGIEDPFNMGAAMAPAAAHTIETHLRDLNIDLDYYDLIATGDLGKVGFDIVKILLSKKGIIFPKEKFIDCGLIIYKENQKVFSGGSGCGCSAVVTYGHLLNKMIRGEINKMLIVATGALMSPISYQQKESIPCVAHAVAIEKEG